VTKTASKTVVPATQWVKERVVNREDREVQQGAKTTAPMSHAAQRDEIPPEVAAQVEHLQARRDANAFTGDLPRDYSSIVEDAIRRGPSKKA
jgi:hypothetical protein